MPEYDTLDYGAWGLPDYNADYYSGGYGDIFAPSYSGYTDPTTEPTFTDAFDGQNYTLSQIQSNPEQLAALQAQYGISNLSGAPLGGTTGAPNPSVLNDPSPGGFFSGPEGIKWGNVIGGGATGLASLLGIAGIAQGLTGGGGQTTTVRQQPGQSPLAGQAGQAALQGLQGAQNYAFGGPGGGGGLAGQLQGMAPAQQQAQLQALLGASQGAPIQGLQSPTMQFNPQTPQAFAAQTWPNYFPGGESQANWSQLPPYLQEEAGRHTAQGGQGTWGPNPQSQGFLTDVVKNYMTSQGGMLNASALGAMGLNNPSAPWLQGQATGMAQGNLPALNPALRAQVGATFAPAYQDLNRYLDTSLQQALERSRQQGFAGGNEVFREGTPGTILSPMWAEGMRQQGTLGGQKAQAELGLAQSLPQLGGNLANQLFMQQLEQNKAMQGAAQGYTAPSAVGLQGGLGLGNLNQNMLQLLGNLGQQGTQNQLNFLQAASAPLQGLTGLSNVAQAGAGMTQTQNAPFSLMSAFAPTASLLGGIGGAMGGYNATQPQRPTYSGWAG